MSESDKIYQFIAQHRPPGTDPELLFSPQRGQQVIAKLIYVVNLGNKDLKFSIYFDHDGSDTGLDEAVAYEATVKKGTTQPIEIDIPLRRSDGTLHVQTDSGGDINFILFGNK